MMNFLIKLGVVAVLFSTAELLAAKAYATRK